jgi:hypothetical protein
VEFLTTQGQWLTEAQLQQRRIAGLPVEVLGERGDDLPESIAQMWMALDRYDAEKLGRDILTKSAQDILENWITLSDGKRIDIGDKTPTKFDRSEPKAQPATAASKDTVAKATGDVGKLAKTKAGIKQQAKQIGDFAKGAYENIKSDETLVAKVENTNQNKIKGIILKHGWVLKRLGDLRQSYDGAKELFGSVLEVAKQLILYGSAASVTAHHAATMLHHAAIVLQPLIHHLASTAGSMGLY